ncbi:MAG: ABC transporter ATP-binding protein [Melioribacteraceae bacterium]|nr:ABC transporter ATP-binding protein [Melioribacteraceae bacterium]
MTTILKCSNLSREFRKSDRTVLKIIRGIDLEIKKNNITVIIGASGAGKSTLLHLLGGLDYPTSGRVLLNDRDIYKLSDKELSEIRNKNIGFVFQFHHLLPEFTAMENINIPQLIAGLSYDKASGKSMELLTVVGLEDRADHKPAELSGGEQQRVAVARALANSPEIILADEPTGNLDTMNSELIHQLFLKLKTELKQTLLIVTHNPALVEIADRVIEMKDGIIIKS